jgi:hypothetical protein
MKKAIAFCRVDPHLLLGASQVSVFVIEVSTPGPRDARGRLGGEDPLPRILFSAFHLPCEMGEYFTGQVEGLKEGSRGEGNPSTPPPCISPEKPTSVSY